MRTLRLSRHAVHLNLWVSEDYLSSHTWSKCGCHPLPTTRVSKSGPKASSGAPPALVEICWLRARATFLVLLQLLTALSRGGYGLQSSKYLLTGPLLQALRNVVSAEIMLSCMNVLIYKVRPIIFILEMRKLRLKVAKQGHTVEVEKKNTTKHLCLTPRPVFFLLLLLLYKSYECLQGKSPWTGYGLNSWAAQHHED